VSNARDYRGWNEMNTLAWVAELRDRTGIPVVVVNWPVSDEPRDECFNAYDTLHPNARGQRKIAGALAPQLAPILRQRAAEVLPVAPH
jgi:lysophospholipase L1-like esterase